MSANNKNDRSPKDLSVPETMKIAALLAELMPPGALAGKSKEIPLKSAESVEAGDDIPGFGSPALQIEDLDDVEPLPAPPPLPTAKSAVPKVTASLKPNLPAAPRITATVVGGGTAKPAIPPVLKTPAVEPPPLPQAEDLPAELAEPSLEQTPLPPTPVPPPLPIAAAPLSAGDLMARTNWTNEPEPEAEVAPEPEPTPPEPAEPEQSAPPAPKAADPELIPLGNLSTTGFFSLVNWRDDPAKARQPRRSDYGLDEATLTQARRNPFYIIGQPRRPERQTVADVLAELSWSQS